MKSYTLTIYDDGFQINHSFDGDDISIGILDFFKKLKDTRYEYDRVLKRTTLFIKITEKSNGSTTNIYKSNKIVY